MEPQDGSGLHPPSAPFSMSKLEEEGKKKKTSWKVTSVYPLNRAEFCIPSASPKIMFLVTGLS